MNKTYLVMKREIRTTLGRKSFLIFAFGLPLVLAIVAVVFIIIGRDPDPATPDEATPAMIEEPIVEGYVDEGNLIAEMPEGIPPGWLVEYPEASAAQQALEAQEIAGYYLISADYEETGEIVYVKPTYDPLSGGINTSGMEWILLYNLFDGDGELAQSAWDPLVVEMKSLAPPSEATAEDNWIVELFPNLMALFTYMVIIMPAGILVAAITDEKKNRVMEVLMVSVSPRQLIAGKIIAVGLLGFLMTVVWIGLIYGVVTFGGSPLNIPIDFNVPTGLIIWAVVYAVLGYAMYGAQMAGLGALAPDVKDTRSATFVVMGPLILVYVFLIFIVASPDSPVAVALSLFPLTAPVAMITRMTATDVPAWQQILSAVLQVLMAILIVVLVARLFRAQRLLSGQPFAVKQYYKAILGRG